MPKIARGGKYRKDAVVQSKKKMKAVVAEASPLTTAADPEEKSKSVVEPNVSAAPSRGQRKRLAKREQYLRKERLVLSSLKLKRQDEQKKRIDGLDALKQALLDTVSDKVEAEAADEEKPNLLKTNKSRKQMVESEVNHMSLVQQHPAFKADPFATIREHLTNTLAKDKVKLENEARQHAKDRKAKEEQKKVVKKDQGIKKKRGKRFKATRSKTR